MSATSPSVREETLRAISSTAPAVRRTVTPAAGHWSTTSPQAVMVADIMHLVQTVAVTSIIPAPLDFADGVPDVDGHPLRLLGAEAHEPLPQGDADAPLRIRADRGALLEYGGDFRAGVDDAPAEGVREPHGLLGGHADHAGVCGRHGDPHQPFVGADEDLRGFRGVGLDPVSRPAVSGLVA